MGPMVTKKKSTKAAKPSLTKLSDKEVADLEKKLTNFITKVRTTRTFPAGGAGFLMGHGSHAQQ
jgi:hypothetical protein